MSVYSRHVIGASHSPFWNTPELAGLHVKGFLFLLVLYSSHVTSGVLNIEELFIRSFLRPYLYECLSTL